MSSLSFLSPPFFPPLFGFVLFSRIIIIPSLLRLVSSKVKVIGVVYGTAFPEMSTHTGSSRAANRRKS